MKYFLFLLVFIHFSLFSQTDTLVPKKPNLKFSYKNNIQLELFGSGILYSVNYERVLLNKNKHKTVSDVGISRVPMNHFDGICFPVSVNHLFSFQYHHVELGLGMTPYFAFGGNYDGWGNFYSMRIGYRYQKPHRKFIFRAAVIPIVSYPGYGIFAGISIGRGF